MIPPEMLARLIGFDTTSRNSNLDLTDLVRDHPGALRVASELVVSTTPGSADPAP